MSVQLDTRFDNPYNFSFSERPRIHESQLTKIAANDVLTVIQALVSQKNLIWVSHITSKGEKVWKDETYSLCWDKTARREGLYPLLINFNIPCDVSLPINCHFVQWIHDVKIHENEKALFLTGNPVFLNCADFIFLTLILAKCIQKHSVYKIYEEQFFHASDTRYYGIDLKETVDFEKAKPGDIIVACNQHGTPCHLFFYIGNGEGSGMWCYPSQNYTNPGEEYFAQSFTISSLLEEIEENNKAVQARRKLGLFIDDELPIELTFRCMPLEDFLRKYH